AGSWPRIDIVPTSLAGGKPRGMVRVSPRMPREAMWSRFGMRAYSSGVFPPSSAIGSSAIPSPGRTTYVIALVQLQHGGQPREVAGNGERGLAVGARRVAVLQPVPAQAEHVEVSRSE